MNVTLTGLSHHEQAQMEDAADSSPAVSADVLGNRHGAVQAEAKPGKPRFEDSAKQERVSQPALLVLIGGTGIKVGTRVKARFIESHGAVPANVAIVGFDSADDPVACRENRTGSVVTLERGSEFFLLDKVPVSGIKRFPHRHKELYDRLGAVMDQIRRAFIDNGAAAERPQGLVSWVWNAKRVEQILDNVLHRLTERTKDLRYEMEGNRAIKVYIVSSIAGGQGAGALLDAAYLTREKLMELGNLGESSSVVGAMVLPGAFHEIENNQMQANAYALVQELNSLMLGKFPFEATYPGGMTIRTPEPPFDHVYVFDGVDENGKSWTNHEDLTELVAQTFWLFASSEVGTREINSMINESGVLQHVSDDGYGTYAGTAGQAVIRWPAQLVAEQCAVRHSRAMVEHVLDSVDQGGRMAGVTWSVLTDATPIREQVSSTREGVPFHVRLAAPAALEQMPLDDIAAQARNLVENYLQRRIYDDYFVQMNEKASQVKAKLKRDMDERLRSMLDAGRVPQALGWLQHNLGAQERLLTGVTAEQAKLSQAVERHQTGVESAAMALDRATGGITALLPFVGRNQVQGALQTYIEEANSLAKLRISQRAEELTGEVVRTMVNWLEQQLRHVNQVVVRLRQTAEWLAMHESGLAQRTVARSEVSLAEPALVDHFYRKHAGNVAADAQLMVAQSGNLVRWVDYQPSEVGRTLVAAASAGFAPVLQLSVEDVLSLRWNDRSAQQWIERLQALAAGAWNLDRSLLKGGGVDLASFLTIGVPADGQTIFANCGHTLVSTHDPERIVVLRTVYGASFDALKPFAQWRRAYDRLAPRRPLHVIRQYHHSEARTAQAFALGLIYNHLYNAVTWYYYRPADPLKEPTRLGQGLENAFAVFRDRRELEDEVLGRVEAQIAAEGTAKAVAQIQGWIDRGGSQDETLKKLRRAVRDYLATLQIGQPSANGDGR